MPKKPNMEKYNRYVQLKGDLKKAMAAGFYYQAIFIEYAIMEDRCWSALEHAGVECLTKTGKDIGIVQKLDRMQKRKEFSDKLSQKYFTEEFFEALRSCSLCFHLGHSIYLLLPNVDLYPHIRIIPGLLTVISFLTEFSIQTGCGWPHRQ